MTSIQGLDSTKWSITPPGHSAMLGLGVHRPDRVITNEDICRDIDSTPEWIESRSGIKTRRFAHEDETVQDMAVAAARKALDISGVAPDQVSSVIIATSSYPYQTPPAASLVADSLGTGGAGSIDISAGCAGFCYGLGMASDMVRSGTQDYVLVIGVEKMSHTTDPHDRTTRFIFGDGAGAVVVGRGEHAGIGPVVWGSDGSQGRAIRQEPDWTSFANNPTAFERRPWVIMEGISVFRWAAFEMGKVALQVLDRTGIAKEDLKAFIPHQANARITDVIARSIHLPEHVAVSNDIAETGNTSAASIPLAMEEMLRNGRVQEGDLALLLGFGAGLSYAGQVVTMPKLGE